MDRLERIQRKEHLSCEDRLRELWLEEEKSLGTPDSGLSVSNEGAVRMRVRVL